MMDVSIIYVNYYTSKLLNESLDTLYRYSSDFTFDVIIVDNSNDLDEKNELMKLKYKYTGISLYFLDENVGFGRANNYAVERTESDYVFFLNPDTLFVENSILVMLNKMKMDKEIGVIGCNLITKDMKPNHSFGKFNKSISSVKKENSLFQVLMRKIKGPYYYSYNYSSNDCEVGYVCGAALLTPRELFLNIGGFDNEIFMYSEEDEYCLFVKRNGKKVLNTPKTKIIHFEGGSFDNEFSENRFKRYINGACVFFKNCYSVSDVNKYIKLELKIRKKKRLLTFNSIKRRQLKSEISILNDINEKILLEKYF